MPRLAFAALVLAACGTTDDQRPRNLEYVTEAILAPNCGVAVCHSTFSQEDGFVFDTVKGARATFTNDAELIGFSAEDPNKLPGLYLNLTLEQPGAPRMPYTEPLPDPDIELIKEWLQAGGPGLCVTGTNGCLESFVIPCVDVQFGKGAYDISALERIGTATGPRNCAAEGRVCVNGACQ